MVPSSIMTFWSLTQAPSTFLRVLVARAMPCWTASSKPFSEIALISVTVATLISSFESPLLSDARSLLLTLLPTTWRGWLNISRRLLRLGVDIAYSPVPIGQDRRRGDAHIVGYYAPEQRVKPREGLGHRGGAQRFQVPRWSSSIDKIFRRV